MSNELKEKKFIIEAQGFAKGKITRYIKIYAQNSKEAIKIWEDDPSCGEVIDSDFEIESVDFEEILGIDDK